MARGDPRRGKPVVAADAGALPLLVRDGENGRLFEPGDVGTLAARLTGGTSPTDAREGRWGRRA